MHTWNISVPGHLCDSSSTNNFLPQSSNQKELLPNAAGTKLTLETESIRCIKCLQKSLLGNLGLRDSSPSSNLVFLMTIWIMNELPVQLLGLLGVKLLSALSTLKSSTHFNTHILSGAISRLGCITDLHGLRHVEMRKGCKRCDYQVTVSGLSTRVRLTQHWSLLEVIFWPFRHGLFAKERVFKHNGTIKCGRCDHLCNFLLILLCLILTILIILNIWNLMLDTVDIYIYHISLKTLNQCRLEISAGY